MIKYNVNMQYSNSTTKNIKSGAKHIEMTSQSDAKKQNNACQGTNIGQRRRYIGLRCRVK